MAKRIKLEWNPAGYSEFLNSPGVQGVLDDAAEAIRDSAEAKLGDTGYDGPNYEVSSFRIKARAQGRVVRTANYAATAAESRRKLLAKSLDAGRR